MQPTEPSWERICAVSKNKATAAESLLFHSLPAPFFPIIIRHAFPHTPNPPPKLGTKSNPGYPTVSLNPSKEEKGEEKNALFLAQLLSKLNSLPFPPKKKERGGYLIFRRSLPPIYRKRRGALVSSTCCCMHRFGKHKLDFISFP